MRSIRSCAGAVAVTGAIAALAAAPGLAAAAPAGPCQHHQALCAAAVGFHLPPSDVSFLGPHWPGPPDPGPMHHINPGDWVALNPQPLPPGGGIDWVALNPQPLPPGPGDLVSLNPQPIPPGVQDLVGQLAPGIG